MAKQKKNSIINFKTIGLPTLLLVTIILGALFNYVWKDVLSFNFALIPLVIGGAKVIIDALEATIKKKKDNSRYAGGTCINRYYIRRRISFRSYCMFHDGFW